MNDGSLRQSTITKGQDDRDLQEIDVDQRDVENLPPNDELGLWRENDRTDEWLIFDFCFLLLQLGKSLVELAV